MVWLVANNGLQSQVKEKRRTAHGRWRTKVDQLLLLITKIMKEGDFPLPPFPIKEFSRTYKAQQNHTSLSHGGDKGHSDGRRKYMWANTLQRQPIWLSSEPG